MRPIDTDYHHVCFLHRPVFSTRKLKEVETRRAKMERLSRSQAHRIRVRGSARLRGANVEPSVGRQHHFIKVSCRVRRRTEHDRRPRLRKHTDCWSQVHGKMWVSSFYAFL